MAAQLDSRSERRGQILRSAERLFRYSGIAKTTVADIARDAEVGVGTVYLEFSSKEAIAAALSDERHDHILDAMRAAIAGDGDFSERLSAMFDARFVQLARVAKSGQHGMDLLRSRCSATQAVCDRFRAEQERLVAEFLVAAGDAGAFDVPDPGAIARVLLRIYDGYGPAALCGKGNRRIRREIETTHALVLAGLLRRTSR